ncbi:GntR family transcriptional regulator [Nocardioides sp. TRM66260-LWL]|uniref:GntR family transcriptional regulator n=1 Tax=Nocardioides sp. TRM66260-LWL TaxID=2874478 RepID=UPI001CC3975B|nr:GntR family transcriptional regulator [Nocardioides sp. TRM66260-LWL]MBZ5735984.1 GntR family transcriptional regulator [Nocardioides sp. TRM66260-LWL]
MTPAPDVFAGLQVDLSTTVDRVAEELRRAIFDGELESGTALREVALAGSLGVSRSTVREALALLVAEGLAVREPNRGVSVAIPDAEAVSDLCHARLVLEGAGVRAWAQADEAARAHVRERLAAYTGAVADGAGYRELNARHLAFHVALVELTGSPRLVAMQESLVRELRLALAQVERIRRNAHDQADTHAELVALLDAGRLDDALTFLDAHLAGAETAILAALALGA